MQIAGAVELAPVTAEPPSSSAAVAEPWPGAPESAAARATDNVHRAGKRMGDLPGVTGLPPEEVWLLNPVRDKFPTPVDERGLIIVSDLVQAVKDSVDPAYVWPMHLSVHHIYWPDQWYDRPEAGPHGQGFRQLPVNKALLPRVFENWLHKITIEPVMPDPDVMKYRLDAWNIAESLFRSVREAVRWERRAARRTHWAANQRRLAENPDGLLPADFIDKEEEDRELLADIIGRHFKGIEHHMEKLAGIPAEFRVIEPVSTEGALAEQLSGTVGRELGRLVVRRSLHLTRTVFTPTRPPRTQSTTAQAA